MSSSFRRPAAQRRQQQHQQQQQPLNASLVGNEASETGHVANVTNQHFAPRLRGTKPWTNGITLTSMGVRDVDSILGGGQPLGTCIIIEEDRWTLDFGLSLVRYWCAEAISQEQYLWIPILHHDHGHTSPKPPSSSFHDEPTWNTPGTRPPTERRRPQHQQQQQQVEELLRLLPRNLHWDKQTEKQNYAQQQQEQSPLTSLEPLLEGEDDDDSEGQPDDPDGDHEDGLQIAWQYRKSIQQQRMGHASSSSSSSSPSSTTTSPRSAASSSNIFCHSYDLSGCMTDQKPWSEILQHYCTDHFSCGGGGTSMLQNYRTGGFLLFQKLFRRLQELIQQHPNQVVRLLLYRVEEEACCDMMSVALPLLLASIRQYEWPVVMLMTVQSWKLSVNSNSNHSSSSLASLRRTADVAMQLEAFAARRDYPPPPEFRQFQGVMVLQKLAPTSVGHFAQTMLKPPAMVYGMKRDRRKLHTSLLHIPPEDYFAQGSVGTGAVRSGASRCATSATNTSSSSSSTTSCGGSGKSSSMDF